jgi:hypothetical protein
MGLFARFSGLELGAIVERGPCSPLLVQLAIIVVLGWSEKKIHRKKNIVRKKILVINSIFQK